MVDRECIDEQAIRRANGDSKFFDLHLYGEISNEGLRGSAPTITRLTTDYADPVPPLWRRTPIFCRNYVASDVIFLQLKLMPFCDLQLSGLMMVCGERDAHHRKCCSSSGWSIECVVDGNCDREAFGECLDEWTA